MYLDRGHSTSTSLWEEGCRRHKSDKNNKRKVDVQPESDVPHTIFFYVLFSVAQFFLLRFL